MWVNLREFYILREKSNTSRSVSVERASALAFDWQVETGGLESLRAPVPFPSAKHNCISTDLAIIFEAFLVSGPMMSNWCSILATTLAYSKAHTFLSLHHGYVFRLFPHRLFILKKHLVPFKHGSS